MGAKDGRAAPFQQGRFSNAPRRPLYSRFRSQGIARNLDEDLQGDVRRPPPHLSPLSEGLKRLQPRHEPSTSQCQETPPSEPIRPLMAEGYCRPTNVYYHYE